MGKNIVDTTDDFVKVRHVLVSVSDKDGLDTFIPQMLEINPDVKILSTGGTFRKLQEILGKDAPSSLIPVSEYTGQPETQGGLVKTLDFKIYLGLLTETYNDDHQEDMRRTAAVNIDMAVVNLYPFRETIAKPGVTVEDARGNIDIGGPCMIRAAAKNFLRVASVVNPADYGKVLEAMKGSGGMTSLELRFELAQKAFEHTAGYDRMIADYLASRAYTDAEACYNRR